MVIVLLLMVLPELAAVAVLLMVAPPLKIPASVVVFALPVIMQFSIVQLVVDFGAAVLAIKTTVLLVPVLVLAIVKAGVVPEPPAAPLITT